MSKKVIVIGAGPAGYVCAIRLAQLGQQVTVVEKEFLGGTCLNVGCIPSKALIAAGALLHKIGEASAMGIQVSGVKLDLARLVDWKAGIVAKLTGGVGGLLKSHKVEVVMGAASFVDKNTLSVKSKDGAKTLRADEIVIATGSVPIAIPGFAFDEDQVWSSTGALAPRRLPQHLVVIGGGYIGLELGMMYKKLGRKVSVIEATAGALPGQERDCVKVIERSLKKLGIDLLTETLAQGLRAQERAELRAHQGQGRREHADLRPDRLDRRAPAVQRGPGAGQGRLEGRCQGLPGGRQAHAHERPDDLRHRRHRRAADVGAQGLQGGPGGRRRDRRPEGRVRRALRAGRDLHRAGDGLGRADRGAVPGAEARDQDRLLPLRRLGPRDEPDGHRGLREDHRRREDGRGAGRAHGRSRGDRADRRGALAIEMGATSEDLARTIHAHPTLPEAVMEAAEAVHGMAVHIYQRK
jgi:dihydrolipoamide dehydrogenase